MAKKQKNDAYAICTAQKKKSGMGHDEWKRCVDKVKTQESTMNFYKKAKKIFEEESAKAAYKKKESDKRALASAEKLKKPKGRWPHKDQMKHAQDAADSAAIKSTRGDKLAAKRPGEVERAHRASAEFGPPSHQHNTKQMWAQNAKLMARKKELEKRKKLRQSGKPKDGDGDGIVNEHERKILMNFLDRVKLLERCRKKNEDAAPFSKPAPFSVAKDSEDGDGDGVAGEDDPKGEQPTYASDRKSKSKSKSNGKKNEATAGKMTNTLPDGPKQAGRTPSNKEEDDLDAEDTMGEMAVNAEKKDNDWIQKAVDPDHEGYCTPMTKSTCTPKRKALARTFKKMGRKRDAETKAKNEEWSDASRKAAADSRRKGGSNPDDVENDKGISRPDADKQQQHQSDVWKTKRDRIKKYKDALRRKETEKVVRDDDKRMGVDSTKRNLGTS